MSPREYQRIQVGITKTGHLQVWCVRHECEVMTIDFDRYMRWAKEHPICDECAKEMSHGIRK